MRYYVDASARSAGCGSQEYPFRTIQAAADVARAGDEVLVAPGIYRESVNPKHAGTEEARIVYKSMEPRAAVITGAEPLTGWVREAGAENVWKVRVKNGIFGDYNPYRTRVSGDWFIAWMRAHTGEVYLNHKSMYEVAELEEVIDPKPLKESWDMEFSTYVWYADQDEERNETVFYANFQGKDPNKEEVGFSVRQNCFMPKKTGVDHITLSGFTIREAATQWAPPTAYQDGMVGPHWSKGWIIEDCEIYESKCSGISLGKYLQPQNDNKWLKMKYKDGTQTQRECVCQASYEGWDREHVGGHLIRRCEIHDCGQTGIVGHLGGAFSVIEDNHIYHINHKHNLDGAEIGGIKMHAPIDTVLRHNHIHHCARGIWLDWQAQGTRVTQNLLHDNCLAMDRNRLTADDESVLFGGLGEDLFIEVSHGPTLVDNNLLLSERSLKFAAQGGAFVHNLFAGSLTCIGTGTRNGAPDLPSDRYTPYHESHGTRIMGFMTILHGDVRFYNNIFAQRQIYDLFIMMQKMCEDNQDDAFAQWDTMNFKCGTFVYDDYPDSREWKSWFEGYCGMGGQTEHPNRYYDHLPVWSEGNVYLGGAAPWKKEKEPVVDDSFPVRLELVEKDGQIYLDTNIFERLSGTGTGMMSTESLEMAFEPEEKFENPDGSALVLNMDYWGEYRSVKPVAGPFADPVSARPVWENSRDAARTASERR